MAINKIIAADKLRFETMGGTVITVVSIISDDIVNTVDVDGKIQVVVPIYGNPYIKFDNPSDARYTKGAITIEGTLAGLQALSAVVDGVPTQKVKLVIGGTSIPEKVFFSCVLTGVSIKRNLIKGDNWATGQVSFIKL